MKHFAKFSWCIFNAFFKILDNSVKYNINVGRQFKKILFSVLLYIYWLPKNVKQLYDDLQMVAILIPLIFLKTALNQKVK